MLLIMPIKIFCIKDNFSEIRDDIKERVQENQEIELTDEEKEAF